MRKAQVVIKVDLFGDASNERFEGWEPVCVYADANNIYEALASSYYEVLVALQENGHKLPSFGRREHIDTAELIRDICQIQIMLVGLKKRIRQRD